MNPYPKQRKLTLLPNKILTSPHNSECREVLIRSPSDFRFVKFIEEGNFSTICLTEDVLTDKKYAIKVVHVPELISERKCKHVLREVEALRVLGNSSKYFVHLNSIFKVPERFCIALTYAKNGNLLKYIKLHKKFNIEFTRYYSAQLVLALEHLHLKKIVHRDLKPEHILIDHNFHILITGFGRAKIVKDGQNQTNDGTEHSIPEPYHRRNSFLGTAQFVSPEMLLETKSSYSSDLWALGCIVFQMVSGRLTFRGRTKSVIFQNIIRLEYTFPANFDEKLKDFVEKLLILDPEKRLGATDEVLYTSLRGHDIFDGVNWDNLRPPPQLSGTEIIQKCNDSMGGTLKSKEDSKQPMDNTLSQTTVKFDDISHKGKKRKRSKTNEK